MTGSYFYTPALTGLLQQLKHLSLFSMDTLVVEGESGSGKTALVAELGAQLNEQESAELKFEHVCLVVRSGVELEVFLSEIAHALGLKISDNSPGAVLAQLRAYTELAYRERRVVQLALDDAHLMSEEALGALLSLVFTHEDSAFGFKLMLLAEPGFVQRIDALSPAEFSVYDFQLEGLSTQELERFLSLRVDGFAEAQAHGKLPSVAAIWNRANGQPGKALSHIESLTQSNRAGLNLPDTLAKMPILHLSLLTFLVAGLILTLIYRGGGDDSKEPAGSEDGPRVLNQLVDPESVVSVGAKEPEVSYIKSSLSEEGAPQVASEDGEDDAEASQHNPVNLLDVVGDVPVTGAHSGNDVVLGAELGQGDLQVEQDQTNNTESLSTESAATSSGQASLNGADLSASETFLLGLSDSAYVLQLVAASQKDSLIDYIQQQPNADELHLYRRVKRNGGLWYIVVLGPYADRAQAQRSISSLPEAQKKAGPWPRSVKLIRSEIEEFRDN